MSAGTGGPSTGDVVVALVVAAAFTTTLVVVAAATAFAVVVVVDVVVVVTFDNKLRLILSTSSQPIRSALTHAYIYHSPHNSNLSRLETVSSCILSLL